MRERNIVAVLGAAVTVRKRNTDTVLALHSLVITVGAGQDIVKAVVIGPSPTKMVKSDTV